MTGLLSIPLTFFISNDAFYFGILPILAKAGQVYGITAAEMGRASVLTPAASSLCRRCEQLGDAVKPAYGDR